jgi:hypothetical protein
VVEAEPAETGEEEAGEGEVPVLVSERGQEAAWGPARA